MTQSSEEANMWQAQPMMLPSENALVPIALPMLLAAPLLSVFKVYEDEEQFLKMKNEALTKGNTWRFASLADFRAVQHLYSPDDCAIVVDDGLPTTDGKLYLQCMHPLPPHLAKKLIESYKICELPKGLDKGVKYTNKQEKRRVKEYNMLGDETDDMDTLQCYMKSHVPGVPMLWLQIKTKNPESTSKKAWGIFVPNHHTQDQIQAWKDQRELVKEARRLANVAPTPVTEHAVQMQADAKAAADEAATLAEVAEDEAAAQDSGRRWADVCDSDDDGFDPAHQRFLRYQPVHDAVDIDPKFKTEGTGSASSGSCSSVKGGKGKGGKGHKGGPVCWTCGKDGHKASQCYKK